MKRKIKKGVQILTDLLEVLLNGQREILKADSAKKDPNNDSKTNARAGKQDRYQDNENEESQNLLDEQQQLMLETVNDR